MLHVSDLIHAKRCERFAYNCRYEKIEHEPFYHLQTPYSHLWSAYLNIEDVGSGKVGDSNEKTFQLLAKHKVLKNARFSYKELRTKIPVLIQEEDGIVLIYPFLSANPKESEALRIKIDTLILEEAGLKIKAIKALSLNKEYCRKDALDLNELFVLSDHLFNRRNKPSKPILELIDQIEVDLDLEIDLLDTLFSSSAPSVVHSRICTQGRKCSYYDLCFQEEEKEPNDSILFLSTSQNKLEAYEKGVTQIKELDPSLLEGFPLQYAQYMASKMNRTFIDGLALQTWLSKIEYPISYLDFEWDTFPIPPYQNMHPFDVLCFQYSLHIERKNGTLGHVDFFGTGDCRKDFIESLIENVPKEGTILVYNMDGAEKLRLIQLSEQFPEYEKDLMAICERMIDLSKPFEQGIYYDSRMRGHYSLKNLLPVFRADYTYEDLDIQNGMSAVYAYRNYEKSSASEQADIQHAIRVYCMMDTYAEHVIFHGLQHQLEQYQKQIMKSED